MPTIDDQTLAQNLVRRGLLNDAQLDEARQDVESSGGTLVQALLRLGYISAHEIAQAVEAAVPEPVGLQSVVDVGLPESPAPAGHGGGANSLASYDVDPGAVRAIPRSLAEEYQVLPITMSDDRLLLAMADATNVLAIDAVRVRTGRHVEPVQIDGAELAKAIETQYNAQARARAAVAQRARDLSASVVDMGGGSGGDNELLGMLDQAPVVRIVESIVREAVRQGASDIHMEPRHDRLQIRYRIDGVLQTQTNLPKDMQQYVLSRIKILAEEDISETRKPQSGRFEFIMDDRPIDLRVSTMPTFWGEKAVLRLLDKSRVFVSLTQLGFQPDMMEHFERLLRMPQGLVLVTGPTGSGKSTTLYAALHTINDDTKNITTVEDPIEYEVEGLNQVQVNQHIGVDFSAVLRETLRQDPDVILVGEIRDLETAQMTFRAAMTGHLVLSTLHTNDAPSAATRLADMGIPPYIVGSSMTGVLAQRLVRRICTRCRAPHQPTPQELSALGLTAESAAKIKFYWGRGCAHCRNTGYTGRVALYELMIMNDEIRRALSKGEDASVLRQIALRSGMKPLRYDGLAKVHQGVTTAQEVIG
ncbi:MAG TPA: ATPase, T2SS/T4P/T4SS family, partial [Armatimonadota bacterium]